VDERPGEHIRLLKDDAVNGVDVYVLEIKHSNDTMPEDRYSVVSRSETIYIGKSDLLPRKVISTVTVKHKGKVKQNTTISMTFSGFHVNPKLQDELFDTKPPMGARRM
jgi:outer membrane lipoprotein-sorting protein